MNLKKYLVFLIATCTCTRVMFTLIIISIVYLQKPKHLVKIRIEPPSFFLEETV